MGVESFYLFFISAMIFILTPGIDTVYVLNKSLCQGWKSGVYSSLGISGGIIVHTLFAALGRSVLLATLVVVFCVIRYLVSVYFVFSCMILILTPVIDTVYVLNKSLCQGWKSGVYSSLGISGGIIVHTLFAALGLSVILAKSAVVFSVIKYLGAVYLVYLGIKAFCSKNNMMVSEGFGKKDESNWKCFQTGI